MKLAKRLRVITLVTVISLVYIGLQMQVVQLAYEAKDKENKIEKLEEQKQLITSKVLALKSSNHIGEAFLTKQSGLDFMNPENVIQIASDENIIIKKDATQLVQHKQPLRQLMDFFATVETQAEADIR